MPIDLVNLQPTLEEKAPKLVIYGPPGAGKTNFGSKAPEVVIGDTEDSLTGVEANQVKIRSWNDAKDFLEAIYTQPHRFKSMCIDTVDWLERIIHVEVCKVNRVASIDDIGYGKGYGFALDYWDYFLKCLTAIRNDRNMPIILLAHEKIKRFDDPMMQGYDRYMLKLNDKAAALLIEWADAVLFMKTKTILVTEKGELNKDKKRAKDGGGVYMYSKDSPAYQAKCRVSLNLPDEFPISEKNAWNDFMSQIGKGN